jgi:hypothetical protein
LLLLLKALPHDYLDRLNAPRSQIALYHVRRAEAFMREQGLHRHRPARGGGGRERADALLRIQAAPQRDADEISQAVAPDGARRAAHRPRRRVAASCGYANLSQFSRDYRELYGESPAHTLRGSVPPN